MFNLNGIRADRRAWFGAVAVLPLLIATGAHASDVTVSSNVTTGVNLDAQVGSTIDVLSGVTVSNAALSRAITASTSAWSLTNRGGISSSLANTIQLTFVGSSVTNFGSITAGSVSNAISMTAGGSVDNKVGATISSALSSIIIGASAAPATAVGTVTNAGTINQTGTSGDLVTLLTGGSVTNLAGGIITANNSSNAVSVGQGTSRSVSNAGTISNTGANFATGVLMQGGASTLTNTSTGRISGTFNGVYASATAPLTFSNDGLIESTGPNVAARAVEATGGGTFVNTGTIRSASSDGLYLARGGTVTNRGTISGATHAINFSGNFARTLNLDTGSVLNGNVQGGTGVDSLVLLGSGTEDLSKFLAFETVSLQGSAWQLNGAGAFATSAEVQSGTLTVAGALTTPTTTVQTGGTLTGSGSISGAVNVLGTLAGTQGQTLTLGSLTLGSGSNVNATLGAPGGATLFNVTGALALDGTLNVTAAPGFGVGVYRIMTYGGALTDNGLNIGAVPAGSTADYAVQTSVAGQVNLVRTAPVGPFNFWDGAGPADNGVIEGGSGTWSTTSANWANLNGASNAAMSPQPGFAIFEGAAGTVTVDASGGAIGITGMQFASSGYTVAGGTIALTAAQTAIRVGDSSAPGANYTATISSALTGAGGLEKTDLGGLVLTGANTYAGGTTVTGGSLTGSAGSFGAGAITDNATLILNQTTDAVLANTVNGSGTLIKRGAGSLSLTGSGTLSGATRVEAGRLAVNGAFGGSAVTVLNGAILGGIGTVGGISAQSGAVIAPGNSIGTLTVNGAYTQAAGSTYQVELTSTGLNDRINVTGAATLASGAVLNVVKTDTAAYTPGTRYTVLSAAGGVTGTYSLTGDTTSTAFIRLNANYDASHVYLDVIKMRAFAEAGLTPNQIAAGQGVDSLTMANPLSGALALLTSDAAARAALDQVSGEIHASAKGALLDDSRFVRDAVNDRLRAAPAGSDGDEGGHLWSRAYGAWGVGDSDGNAARLDRDLAGVFVGGDAGLGDKARLGVLAGYSRTDLKAANRASAATSDNYDLAVYAGWEAGQISLRSGAAYAWHRLETARRTAIPGLTDDLQSRYDAGTAQVFAEAALDSDIRGVKIQPFADVAYVRLSSDDFMERGGAAAALSGASKSLDDTFTTLGARVSVPVKLGGFGATLDGALGWKHAFGDAPPTTNLSFGGGSSFLIQGLPLDKDSAAIDLALSAKLKGAGSIGLAYGAQFGSRLSDQTVSANLRIKF